VSYFNGPVECFVPRVAVEPPLEGLRPSVSAPAWDEARFYGDLEARAGADAVAAARKIVQWAATRGLRAAWGGGAIDGSYYPILDHVGDWYAAVTLWSYGKAELQFQWFRLRRPFDDEQKRLEFRDRLNEIDGVSIPPDAITRRPSILLTDLNRDDRMEAFLRALDWFYDEVLAAE
jgi:hypothetical protein